MKYQVVIGGLNDQKTAHTIASRQHMGPGVTVRVEEEVVEVKDRDLLLEFIAWSVDNSGMTEDIFEDPDAAIAAVDAFLDTEEGDERPS